MRSILLAAVASTVFTGCTFDELLMDPDPAPAVVYVREPTRPASYDPYYNRPKVYVESRPYYPPRDRYYESQKKKVKNGKVYRTTTVTNQYGQTVYKNTTTSKKKKKK